MNNLQLRRKGFLDKKIVQNIKRKEGAQFGHPLTI